MQMRELVTLLESNIKMKMVELSRMEKEMAITKSMLRNDINELYKVLNTHYPFLVSQSEEIKE